MADALGIIRDDALLRRVKGIAGGNRIEWSAKDIGTIRDYVAAMPDEIIRATPTVARKLLDLDRAALLRSVAEVGIEIKRDMQPDDRNLLYTISAGSIDLSNDLVKQAGIDAGGFNRNPIILPRHDSSALPVATSSAPWASGNTTLAIARFPQPGISAESDQVAAAIRAGLFRGASIGFVPLKWSFTKDPSRPLGVDFHAIKLLEWSLLPCCPDCLLIGAVSGGKSASDVKTADLRREARALAAKARSISESIQSDPIPTREQRLAEARNFKHLAGRS